MENGKEFAIKSLRERRSELVKIKQDCDNELRLINAVLELYEGASLISPTGRKMKEVSIDKARKSALEAISGPGEGEKKEVSDLKEFKFTSKGLIIKNCLKVVEKLLDEKECFSATDFAKAYSIEFKKAMNKAEAIKPLDNLYTNGWILKSQLLFNGKQLNEEVYCYDVILDEENRIIKDTILPFDIHVVSKLKTADEIRKAIPRLFKVNNRFHSAKEIAAALDLSVSSIYHRLLDLEAEKKLDYAKSYENRKLRVKVYGLPEWISNHEIIDKNKIKNLSDYLSKVDKEFEDRDEKRKSDNKKDVLKPDDMLGRQILGRVNQVNGLRLTVQRDHRFESKEVEFIYIPTNSRNDRFIKVKPEKQAYESDLDQFVFKLPTILEVENKALIFTDK